MPPDNADTVAPGTDVSFPQNGPNGGSDIVRTGPSSFNLYYWNEYNYNNFFRGPLTTLNLL